MHVARYMHAKKYNEAIELLNSGAVAMLNHGEVSIHPRFPLWYISNEI